MKMDEITADLSSRAFDFFYWFSRFEFALKENGYLKSHQSGAKAEPGWEEFVVKWNIHYLPSLKAKELLASPPERQIVLGNDTLDWKSVGLADCRSELEKIVRLIKTVRNNLFHGGKHGGAGWDDAKRTESLLVLSKDLLDEFAVLASIEADYYQHY
ncbi:hypothetical protein D3C72_151160 [compost metagenome]